MKIAVATEGENEKDKVSPVYGRAVNFLIFENGKIVKTIKNPFKVGGGGAGFGVTQMLAKEGVEKVIAGNFGEKVLNYLEEKNIKHQEASDKIIEDII